MNQFPGTSQAVDVVSSVAFCRNVRAELKVGVRFLSAPDQPDKGLPEVSLLCLADYR